MLDDAELRELLEELIAIESVNPDLDPSGAGEDGISEFVAGWLTGHGVEVVYQDVVPGRRNVIGRVPGHGHGSKLLLNAHLDTVGVAGWPGALSPVVSDGRLYGRGAEDMKSGLAAAMAVVAATVELDLAGELLLAAVVDEEGESKGTQALVRQWSADFAIALEPSGHRVAPVHKGFVWADIETSGIAAHGSDPDRGVDAITGMGHVLVELDSLARDLRSRVPASSCGSGSLHASLINGGTDPSTYPDRCRLLVERRTVPGESAEQVLAELEAALAAAAARDRAPTWGAGVSLRLIRPPLETPPDSPLVRALEEACRSVLGSADVGPLAFWTDAALMSAAGISSAVFGVKGGGMHAGNEWVELASVRSVAEVILKAAGGLSAGRPPED